MEKCPSIRSFIFLLFVIAACAPPPGVEGSDGRHGRVAQEASS